MSHIYLVCARYRKGSGMCVLLAAVVLVLCLAGLLRSTRRPMDRLPCDVTVAGTLFQVLQEGCQEITSERFTVEHSCYKA